MTKLLTQSIVNTGEGRNSINNAELDIYCFMDSWVPTHSTRCPSGRAVR